MDIEHGLSNEDVDDEAVIGLIKAIDHFDYKKGNKVITLAKMYIMNEIISSCNKSGYVQRQSDKCLRMILKINTDYNHNEFVYKISIKTGLNQNRAQNI